MRLRIKKRNQNIQKRKKINIREYYCFICLQKKAEPKERCIYCNSPIGIEYTHIDFLKK